ncbi:5-demethoxyubiquinol-8 5-hydroxylase UbiM [Sphingomonas sp.]|uniref:5-demethoxyubiquinol-8 5-hydroxylase UbiM n=1 Tax=Sphingomonas sp. TaxID=28214 RepID=UPI003B3B2364
MDCDVIVIGGGPAGLAFARGLASSSLAIVLVERQSLAALAEPADDGREIALTHRSADRLKRLGAWDHIDPTQVAPLSAARVLNGASPFALAFGPAEGCGGRLGQLVSNWRLRRALFAATEGQTSLNIRAGAGVTGLRRSDSGVEVELTDRTRLRARLLVAADSRFSETRARLGIAADICRLGKSMLVVPVEHQRPHDGVALEWFGHGQTIACLPLADPLRSSVVLTLPEDAIARLAMAEPALLAEELSRRSAARLGPLRPLSRPFVYPLATVWSRHFAAPRAALIGDAAVGMHPVTAHGFNLGLLGAATLATRVTAAARSNGDIGAATVLRGYETTHRLAAAPLFAATGAIVRLFTDDRPAARLARPALLRAASLAPVRAGVSRLLARH